MSIAYSLTYTCDACGNTGPGTSASIYSLPPRGWTWASEGPHACNSRCWVLLAGAHYARTQQQLPPISHEDAGVPQLPAGTAQHVPEGYELVEEDEVEAEEEVEEEPPPPPVRTISPKVTPLGQEKKKAAAAKPAAAPGTCVDCGVDLPAQGAGRPRVRCTTHAEEHKRALERERRKA